MVGGGISKHITSGEPFRDGLDYAVYNGSLSFSSFFPDMN
jgi:deoxyhypusine synthase